MDSSSFSSFEVLCQETKDFLLHGEISHDDVHEYLRHAPTAGFICHTSDDESEVWRLDQVLFVHGQLRSKQMHWIGPDRDELVEIPKKSKEYRNYRKVTSFSQSGIEACVRSGLSRKSETVSSVMVYYDPMTVNNILRSSDKCARLLEAAESAGKMVEAENLISSSIRARLTVILSQLSPSSEEGHNQDLLNFYKMDWELEGEDPKNEEGFKTYVDYRESNACGLYCDFSLLITGERRSKMLLTECVARVEKLISAL